MAAQEEDPNAVMKKVFVITMVGSVLYITAAALIIFS